MCTVSRLRIRETMQTVVSMIQK